MAEDSAEVMRVGASASNPGMPELDPQELRRFVSGFLDRRAIFLRARESHGSPLYLLDEQALVRRAAEFTAAFRRELPGCRIYYAVKSNNHPLIAQALVQREIGLDVSSGLELEAALQTRCDDIVFSGPGKTADELSLAARNSRCVTVLLDSFAELDRLQAAAASLNTRVRAGVRVMTRESGIWRKFGISLAKLGSFLQAAAGCSNVMLTGLQFHVSWNMNPSGYIAFLRSLGAALARLQPGDRARVEFIDIGGGFWPEYGEWLHPENAGSGFPSDEQGKPKVPRHLKNPAVGIGRFASDIAAALREHIFPLVSCRICMEPGRWLCHGVMHLLLTVLDRKADDLVITDAGINAIGWERFETDYFPVINLSRPSLVERPCMVMGSLCTPHDLWGYSYHGEGIENGDILLIPDQGAYTYSLRQEFIKPLPKVASV